MKHNYQVIFLLISLFLLSQITGLYLLNQSLETVEENGVFYLEYEPTALGERPDASPEATLLMIIIGLTIGTALLLLLIKYNKVNIWRYWFFLGTTVMIALALSVLINTLLAWILAVIIATLRIKKTNIITQNLAEVLMYAGLAVFIVPLLNIPIMIILLILISIYDMYAVWKSKHMIRMAEFTSKSQLFPGLSLKYNENSESVKKSRKTKKTGMLGGGDVAFPLLFTGVVMTSLIEQGVTKTMAFQQSLIITLTTAIALMLLLILGQKQKFYPAMPFITLGLIIGFLLI